ncbi:ferrochelatase [Filimonas effusa]|uniref:Ferrochelatase n=1 Tax=Filimonas effusa TaxID=2508721 RepID=A0A4Q1D6K1_9BACT|nr:ferrochelatase [Filimonas effusa]RXK83287.1 ferrochelatase [Filimonas effusa]
MQLHKKSAVILMNLGSPDSTEVKDVRKYLDEFLMDKRVINAPYIFRAMLVKGIIVPFRAPKSAEAYRSIWWKEGSPLIVLTKQLQEAVQDKMPVPVEIAMRYGSPSPKAAYDSLLQQVPDLEEVVLFPLYPHYAMSSYETAVEYMKEVKEKYGYKFKLSVIPPYYNHPEYINALAGSIKPFLEQEYDKVVFSYHGVPERHIRLGDVTGCHCLQTEDCCTKPSVAHTQCYRHQTFETTRLVTEALNLPKEKVEQTFQSRLGRDKWLEPATANRLAELPAEGVKKILVVCPAFVSDCLETLEEIAMGGKEIFEHAGGESFTHIPCLNVQPQWVETVVDMSLNAASGN